MTYQDVADRLQVSTRTLKRWINGGVPGTAPREPFPHVRLGRLIRFHESDIEYMENKLRLAMILPIRRGVRPKNTERRRGAA